MNRQNMTDCIPEYLPPESFTGRTVRVPRQSMSELVYGPAPRRRSPVIGAIAIGILIGIVGCASAPRAVDVETVGTLTASETHVAQAPVHATTDFAPAAGVADTGDDIPQGASNVEVLHREAAASGVVEVAPKADGVTVGGAR